jgi:hypothetical protein
MIINVKDCATITIDRSKNSEADIKFSPRNRRKRGCKNAVPK